MSDPVTRLNAALEGRYTIEREGGMATVYLAEIETTANLTHPHILPLFDSGEADVFVPEIPRLVVDGAYLNVSGRSYDLHPDGQRFLLFDGPREQTAGTDPLNGMKGVRIMRVRPTPTAAPSLGAW